MARVCDIYKNMRRAETEAKHREKKEEIISEKYCVLLRRRLISTGARTRFYSTLFGLVAHGTRAHT